MIRVYNRFIQTRNILVFIADSLVISSGIILPIAIRFILDGRSIFSYRHLIVKIMFITAICQLTLLYNDFYYTNFKGKNRLLFIKLLQSMGITSLLLAISYFFLPALIIWRGIFILTMIILTPLLFIWRIAYPALSFFSKDNEKILIIGTGDLALEIGKKIVEVDYVGYKVVGYIDEDKKKIGQSLFNPRILGAFDDIIPIVRNWGIDKIVVAMPEMRGMFPTAPLLKLRLDGVEVEDGVSFYEKISGKIHVSYLRPGWLIFSEGFKRRRIEIGKRIIDILISFLGLLIFAPIMLFAALFIKIDSSGPILLRQERIGEGERVFNLLKFRSMKFNAESDTGPVWASQNDDRITKVGRFIRKLRIDEIPQLINVLKGEMSFVGPRPERAHFVTILKKKIPYYSLRHNVKPGITGWAQIKYPYGASVKDAMEKLQYDIYYIKNMTLLFDFTIVLETIKAVVFGKGAR